MTEDMFVKWVQKLICAVKTFRVKSPDHVVVLLVDFASTHISDKAFDLLAQKKSTVC